MLRRVEDGNTAARILDAAEFVFAEQGYDVASVRTIMRRADAQLGLLSYHFGTKEALLEAVILRRAPALSEIRLRSLRALPAETLTVEALVDAYYGPLIELVADAGWRAYFRLQSQLSQSDRWVHLVKKHLGPTTYAFIDRLQDLAPHAPRAVVVQAWVFGVSTALVLFAGSGQVGAVAGRPTEKDFRAMNVFISGGLQAALGLGPAAAGDGANASAVAP